MQEDFYWRGKFYNFTFLPHGDFLDTCETEGINKGTVDNYFNFKYLYDRYTYLSDETTKLKNSFQENKIPDFVKFNDFVESVDNMNLGDFQSTKDPELKWDVNGEQINYFLYPLKNYKYIKTPPTEVLEEYTDYFFVPPLGTNFTNRQTAWCAAMTSYDIWTDSSQTCKSRFSLVSKTQISPLKESNYTCFGLTIELISDSCPDLTIPNCYISYYLTRYSIDSDFRFCSVPKAILEINFVSTSRDYFLSRISSLLTSAKYEDLNKKQLETMLLKYKNNAQTMIKEKFNIYIQGLKDAYNYYITLYSQIIDLRKNFIKYENVTKLTTGQLDKSGLMKNSNCTFMKSNERVFHYARSLIAEEFFGLSIVYLGMAIFLFINASIATLVFIKLRTEKELSEIRNNLLTIKSIEDRERKYFFKAYDYIETEDARHMGIDLNNKSAFSSLGGLINTKTLIRLFTRKKEVKEKDEKNKNAVDAKTKSFAIIDRFIKREEKNFEERIRIERENKIE
jgi:hypothetical protein